MTSVDLTQLGVSGVVAVLLLIAVKVLWDKYQESLRQNREDREAVLPALQSMTTAMTEFVRVANRLADRERGL